MNERSLKKQEKINKILDYGIKAFREKGYHFAGVQELADACNLSKGSFYQYFETKENFCKQVILRYSENMNSYMRDFFDSHQGPASEVLKEFYKNVVEMIAQSEFMTGCLYADLAAELGGVNQICSQTLTDCMQNSGQILAEIILKGQKDGSIRKDISADKLSCLMTSSFMGSILKMKVNGNTDSGLFFIDEFIGNLITSK